MKTLCLCLAWILVLPALGQDKTPGAAKDAAASVAPVQITNLVHQLGAPDFATRERAESALKELTADEIPALQRAAGADDPEVRLRVDRIIEHLRQRVWLVEVDGARLYLSEFQVRKQRQDRHMKMASDMIVELQKGGAFTGPAGRFPPPMEVRPERVLDEFIDEALFLREADRRQIALTEEETAAALKDDAQLGAVSNLVPAAIAPVVERMRTRMKDYLNGEEMRNARLAALRIRKLLAANANRPFSVLLSSIEDAKRDQEERRALLDQLKAKAVIRKNQEAIDKLLRDGMKRDETAPAE